MAPDPLRRIEPDAGRAEAVGRLNNLAWNDSVFDDFLVMIHIVEKQVERLDALLEAALDPFPLRRLHHARQHVKRPDFFRRGLIAIDVKGDAHMQQGAFSSLLAAVHLSVRQRTDQPRQECCFRPRTPVRQKHFIVKSIGIVIIETCHALAPRKVYAPLPQSGGAPPR